MRVCVDPLAITRLVTGHFQRLRAHPVVGHCLLRVFIEANLSLIDARRTAALIMSLGLGNIDILHRVRDKTNGGALIPGVITGANKKAMCMLVQQLIAHTYVSTLFEELCAPRTAAATLAELPVQMRNFRTTVQINVVTGEPKEVYTGKGAGKKDDMWMALALAEYWLQWSQTDALFLEACARSNFRTC